MNELLRSGYIKKWQDKTDKELIVYQDSIVGKINSVAGSNSVIVSLTSVLELLEDYMSGRDIL